jgi:hypothetical protein
MFETFMMWFPPCALFVTVAYVTEFSWSEQDFAMRAWLRRRLSA